MKKIGCYFTLLLLVGCKEKYMPKVDTPASGFLVVEGVINAGIGPTVILLSRATGLDSIYTQKETGAALEIQSSNGASYPLTEKSNGTYFTEQVPVDPALLYRLHIKTTNGIEYLSDYTEVKISPPIDSVGWEATQTQVNIHVSTHDNQGNSRNYMYDFVETWKYAAAFRAVVTLWNQYLLFPPDSVKIPRDCWKTDTSNRILLASSARFQNDIIERFPLQNISYSAGNRLVQKYSMLVKQWVLTKEGYEWERKVQRNTEQLGTIFDAQPSETGGNVHAVSNPGEKVIGYISCSSISEKRIFIDRSELPIVSINTGYQDCETSLDSHDDVYDAILNSPNLYAIVGNPNGDSVIVSDMRCVDCRMQGGNIHKPDFWP